VVRRSQSFLPDDFLLIRTLISAKKDFRSSRAALRDVEPFFFKFKVCNKNTIFFKSTKTPITGKADEYVKMPHRNESTAHRNESLTQRNESSAQRNASMPHRNKSMT
jgi:hypothetical protein